MKKLNLEELINNADSMGLRKFVQEYAKRNPSFKQLLFEKLSPERITKNNIKDYRGIIHAAFSNNPLRSGSRYSNWSEFGFDAIGVRSELEELLDKIDYFLKYKNIGVAIEICKSMIEVIPEEWEDQFDYEGDVQVMYDGAIDKLEEMLKNNLLPLTEKRELFEWYKEESENPKHDGVGLNTNFTVLQYCFMDSEEMVNENLKLLDQKIQNEQNEYEKGRLILQKINILKEAGMTGEANKEIEENLDWVEVRKIKLESLLKNKNVDLAIGLIREGIRIAEKKSHPGTVADWKDELLKIYLLQKDMQSILPLAEDLLYTGRVEKKYYDILKEQTPKEDWPETIERILQRVKSYNGPFGFNEFRAQVLIENKNWEQLFGQCRKAGINYIEKYEKYLRPHFEEEIYQIFLEAIEKTATITDQNAYADVGRLLKRLKTFEGGKEKAREMIDQYRVVYKRRKKMMEVLDEV